MHVIVHGASGRMGQILCHCIESSDDFELAARIDSQTASDCLASLCDFKGYADCLIDFSHPSATETVSEFVSARALPAVIAVTGQTASEIAKIKEAAQRAPIFLSANLSAAVFMLAEMAAKTAKLFPSADIEIIERHHRGKADVPSGTALMLGRIVQNARPNSHLVIGRGKNNRRQGDIAIHSLRIGDEPGTHEIIFATDSQTISLKHEAHNRTLFAEGALQAAKFIVTQPPGIYSMRELLEV